MLLPFPALAVVLTLSPPIVSDNFTIIAHAIQSGDHTHAAAQDVAREADALIAALDVLEREVSDVGEGFTALVRGVRSRGEELFANWGAPETATDKEEPTETGSAEPKVSILPVTDGEVKGVDTEGVLVGRAKEEVEARLAGVPVEDVRRDEL